MIQDFLAAGKARLWVKVVCALGNESRGEKNWLLIVSSGGSV